MDRKGRLLVFVITMSNSDEHSNETAASQNGGGDADVSMTEQQPPEPVEEDVFATEDIQIM